MAFPLNPWQAIVQRLPKPLQNRYYLTLVLFLFFIVFVDRHDLWTQFRLQRALGRMEDDRVFYQQKIKEAREEADDFDYTKEKFAREHYYMKQPNEDVFIIPDQPK
jgi:cell division protein DivIC